MYKIFRLRYFKWVTLSFSSNVHIFFWRKNIKFKLYRLSFAFWFIYVFRVAIDIYDEHFYSLLLINSWTISYIYIRNDFEFLLFVQLFVAAER